MTDEYKTQRGQETESEKSIAGLLLGRHGEITKEPIQTKYCPVCGEKTLFSVVWPLRPGGYRTTTVKCKCQRAELDDYRRRKEEDEREDKRKKCFHGESAYYKQTFENDDPTKNPDKLTRNTYKKLERMFTTPGGVRNYLEKAGDKAAGFVFTGATGTGKTYLAAACCNAYIDRGGSASFWRVSQLMEEHDAARRQGKDPELFWSEALETKLLVIDDLGVERKNEATLEFVFELIDRRVKMAERGNFVTIITTNIKSEVLERGDKTANNRIYSRIGGAHVLLDLEGDDARNAGKEQMYNAFLEA